MNSFLLGWLICFLTLAQSNQSDFSKLANGCQFVPPPHRRKINSEQNIKCRGLLFTVNRKKIEAGLNLQFDVSYQPHSFLHTFIKSSAFFWIWESNLLLRTEWAEGLHPHLALMLGYCHGGRVSTNSCILHAMTGIYIKHIYNLYRTLGIYSTFIGSPVIVGLPFACSCSVNAGHSWVMAGSNKATHAWLSGVMFFIFITSGTQ